MSAARVEWCRWSRSFRTCGRVQSSPISSEMRRSPPGFPSMGQGPAFTVAIRLGPELDVVLTARQHESGKSTSEPIQEILAPTSPPNRHRTLSSVPCAPLDRRCAGQPGAAYSVAEDVVAEVRGGMVIGERRGGDTP